MSQTTAAPESMLHEEEALWATADSRQAPRTEPGPHVLNEGRNKRRIRDVIFSIFNSSMGQTDDIDQSEEMPVLITKLGVSLKASASISKEESQTPKQYHAHPA